MTPQEQQQLFNNVASIAGDMKLLISTVRRHDKALYGNGQPGVVQNSLRNSTLIKAMGWGFGAAMGLATVLIAIIK